MKLNENDIENIRKRFDTILNEGYGKNMKGWINIGVIKGYSNIMDANDTYLMVDPNYPQTDNLSDFKYRATGFNTKPDGSGIDTGSVPSFYMSRLEIYPQYRDTYYGEVFLGKKKTDIDQKKHEQFMARLDTVGDKVRLKHDSDTKIMNGIVNNSKGKHNPYTNNSDINITFFWGTPNRGQDPSNGGKYTYFCLVNKDDIYDYTNNMERFPKIQSALSKCKYVAYQWERTPSAIAVTCYGGTPISYVCDNSTGRYYNANWELLKSPDGKE